MGDIRVDGPNLYSQIAMFLGVTPAGNGKLLAATYRIAPPGGTWDGFDDGVYTVNLLNNEIADTNGNFIPGPLPVGEFRTAIGSVRTVTNLMDSGMGSLRQAILDANVTPEAEIIQFAQGWPVR